MDLNSRLKSVAGQLECWWEHGDMERPCIISQVLKDDHEPVPDTDDLKKFWTDVDFAVNRRMKIIENTNYYGQAVPYHYIDFGASAMLCALGAEPDYLNQETIWAHPRLDSIEQVFDVTLDKKNFCYSVILEKTRNSVALSGNHHMVTPYAMNGITDILAGLYGTENLLVDLIHKPKQVEAAMAYFKNLWIEAFDEIQKIIIKGNNKGGIGWAGIWAPGTTFPIQEDFSYMISPEMYRRFCLPHVRDIVDTMDYALYHLDGIGAIPHLDALLEIENLNAIQWEPGAGKERLDQWYELIKRILGSGKSVQLYCQPNEVDDLVESVGTKGLLITVQTESNDEAEQLMDCCGDR